jgi:hypothetical protein
MAAASFSTTDVRRLLGMSTLSPAASAERGPAATRLTSGRQTLGSNHDAPQRGTGTGEGAPGALQPADSTWPLWWHIFKDYCAALQGESRRTADRLVQHLETGWTHVTQLQLECERQHAGHVAIQDAWVVHLIGFLETEVLGSFAECAERCARLFAGERDEGEGLDALCSVAFRFERAVALSALASESAHLPRTLKATLEYATNALVDWSADFGALVAVVGHGSPDCNAESAHPKNQGLGVAYLERSLRTGNGPAPHEAGAVAAVAITGAC